MKSRKNVGKSLTGKCYEQLETKQGWWGGLTLLVRKRLLATAGSRRTLSSASLNWTCNEDIEHAWHWTVILKQAVWWKLLPQHNRSQNLKSTQRYLDVFLRSQYFTEFCKTRKRTGWTTCRAKKNLLRYVLHCCKPVSHDLLQNWK